LPPSSRQIKKRQQVPPKRPYFATQLHGFTSQKTVIIDKHCRDTDIFEIGLH